jgi:hypothetical protein
MSSSPALQSVEIAARGANGVRPAVQSTDHVVSSGLTVHLTTATLSSIDYEPVVWVQSDYQSDESTKPNGSHTSADCLPNFELGSMTRASLDHAARTYVSDLTGLKLNYMNQLATFINSDASVGAHEHNGETAGLTAPHLSIGYMALVHIPTPAPLSSKTPKASQSWVSCYAFLPWEDWRNGRPDVIEQRILPTLSSWANAGVSSAAIQARHDQIKLNFGTPHSWDDERVLERYELLRSAGFFSSDANVSALGRPMRDEHRLVLAAALGRLRAKLRYRPVVFELMAAEFTLFELQRTVEGIIGPHLHKQNFRRLVETMGLVEATGEIKTHTGGRPAKLFRFRPGVVLEQQAPGMRVRLGHV